jgi:hypothetical protein
MSESYTLKEHREWIGLLQPVGLVVAPSALERAQLRLQKDVFGLQEEFRSITDQSGLLPLHFPSLFTRVLGWRPEDLCSGESIQDLQAFLPERETLLKADYAIKNVDTGEFEILIKNIDQRSFDEDEIPEGRGWQATPHAKFERHLREKNLSIGIMISQAGLRLVYAPKGETSGYLTFPFSFMRETQGRPLLAALHLLLSEDRLFKGDPKQRLPWLLIESRKFQNDVSTKLSVQVLAALYELVRGLQEADEESKGKLLEEVLSQNKNDVYHALLTVLLRTVFTLYAEDRDLLSNDSVFLNNYSINGLFARLREDFGKHHDSMNLRYGAWAHLLSLYRLIYEGADLEVDSIPGRKGHLFDPDRFPFLEGRSKIVDDSNSPRISDGVVWRVLSNLMTLDGERISYRALDVEQIGSVYETVMGFQLEIADGPSIAIKPFKTHGAPVVINLNKILAEKAEKRTAKLKDISDQKFEGKIADAIKCARTPEDLFAALGKKVADWATPTIIASGSMILQPSDERRRSGSHYTPRTLTGPIVGKALEPVFKKLGENPKPEQILELKICDPAMGSGAFLVETCRQLSELLVKAWAVHNPEIRNEIPSDEDELLFARRLIAQRCLYGIDKNPMAVNLAKLSLWLITFAKQHEFTFLDHNLKCGDSLVGLSISQIAGANWDTGANQFLPHASISDRLNRVRQIRSRMANAVEDTPNEILKNLKKEEDVLLNDLRCIGDAVLYSFFSKGKTKERKEELVRIHLTIETWFASGIPFSEFNGLDIELNWLRKIKGMRPFHWECEFPELFDRTSALPNSRLGFDSIIGNPPFLGAKKIGALLGRSYLEYLKSNFLHSKQQTDLVAYFFQRSFSILSQTGVASLIATNTIYQGDTREAGLTFLFRAGGEIIYCNRRVKWPGEAAVVVCIVAFSKTRMGTAKFIDGISAVSISPFLTDSA